MRGTENIQRAIDARDHLIAELVRRETFYRRLLGVAGFALWCVVLFLIVFNW